MNVQNRLHPFLWLLFLCPLVLISCALPEKLPVIDQGARTYRDYERAFEAYERHNYGTAHKLALKSAAAGSAEAQALVGQMYEQGLGVPRDSEAAAKWYLMAAAQGQAMARNNLGVLYAKGHGVRRDEAEALRWYLLAAEQNYAIAINNVGAVHEDGQGVEQNLAEAVAWYRRAAE
ncbi:MAG: hypothetical protein BWK76_21220, partial [Desulfobulbaceae bacterium A2]